MIDISYDSFEFIKSEFKKLNDNCISINESLNNNIKSIKDLYLNESSTFNSILKGFDANHPLVDYSVNILEYVEQGIKEWNVKQKSNFESIAEYCQVLKKVTNNINVIDSLNSSVELLLKSSSSSVNSQKNKYICELKEYTCQIINQLFNDKIENFDVPLSNIQIGLSGLYQFLHTLHTNSSIILEQQPKSFYNPLNGLSLEFDQISLSNINKQQQQQPQQQQQQQNNQNSQPYKKQDSSNNNSNDTKKSSVEVLKIIPMPSGNEIKLFPKPLPNIKETPVTLSSPPPFIQLLNDYTIHQKLWDYNHFKLNRVYNYSTSTVYSKIITFKSGSSLNSLKFWMPVPPNTQSQFVRYSSFTLHDPLTDAIIGQSQIENNSLFQNMYKIGFNLSQPTSPVPSPTLTSSHSSISISSSSSISSSLPLLNNNINNNTNTTNTNNNTNNNNNNNVFKLKYRVDVDLYKLSLIPAQFDDNYFQNIEPISKAEFDFYLRPTPKINFNTPEFKSFIDQYQLFPKSFSDGTFESVLCFAYRLSLWIFSNIKYKYPHDGNLEPLKTVELRSGDCICHCILVVSILRYNKIPARLLFGRNTELDRPDNDNQTHVKVEFYECSIGWVPWDPSFKDSTPYHKYYFANDPLGNFVTYHIDLVDTETSYDSFYHLAAYNYFFIKNDPKLESDINKYDVKRIHI